MVKKYTLIAAEAILGDGTVNWVKGIAREATREIIEKLNNYFGDGMFTIDPPAGYLRPTRAQQKTDVFNCKTEDELIDWLIWWANSAPSNPDDYEYDPRRPLRPILTVTHPVGGMYTTTFVNGDKAYWATGSHGYTIIVHVNGDVSVDPDCGWAYETLQNPQTDWSTRHRLMTAAERVEHDKVASDADARKIATR